MKDFAPVSPIHTIAAIRGWNAAAILADPWKVDLHDHRMREFCVANRALLEPGLLQMANSADAKERLRIGMLLLEMGIDSGNLLVLDALGGNDSIVVERTLLFLSTARWEQGKGVLLPLDKIAVTKALVPFLSAPDARLRKLAVKVVFRLSDLDDGRLLRECAAHEDIEVRNEAALSLALYYGDAAAWPVLQALFLLAPSYDRSRITHCLTGFAINPDRSLKDQVAAFARNELAQLFALEDNDAANRAWNLLDVIEAMAPVWEMEVWENVLTSRLAPWVKETAKKRLVRRESREILERRISRLLDEESTIDSALSTIQEIGISANTPMIADRLRQELQKTTTAIRLANGLKAMLAIGLAQDDSLAPIVDRVDGWLRFELVTRRAGITAQTMLQALEQTGLLTDATDEHRKRFAEGWINGNRQERLTALLTDGGRMHGFDCETNEDPLDYFDLLGELMGLSRGELVPGAADFVVSDDEKYRIRFDLAGQPEFIDVEGQGWFDVGHVLSGLNGILSKRDSPRRYYALATEDQAAWVVLADAVAMAALVANFAFPLGDPDEARKLGQQYQWGS